MKSRLYVMLITCMWTGQQTVVKTKIVVKTQLPFFPFHSFILNYQRALISRANIASDVPETNKDNLWYQ